MWKMQKHTKRAQINTWACNMICNIVINNDASYSLAYRVVGLGPWRRRSCRQAPPHEIPAAMRVQRIIFESEYLILNDVSVFCCCVGSHCAASSSGRRRLEFPSPAPVARLRFCMHSRCCMYLRFRFVFARSNYTTCACSNILNSYLAHQLSLRCRLFISFQKQYQYISIIAAFRIAVLRYCNIIYVCGLTQKGSARWRPSPSVG